MPLPLYRYQLDPTGINPDNHIQNEIHTLSAHQVRAIAPVYGPIFSESISVYDNSTNRLLTKGIDYQCVELLQEATLRYGKEIIELILIIDQTVSSEVRIDYQALGGLYQNNASGIMHMYETAMMDQRAVDYSNIQNKPFEFPPTLHRHLLDDLYGFEYLVVALERIRNAIVLSDVPAFDALIEWAKDQFSTIKIGKFNGVSSYNNQTVTLTEAEVGNIIICSGTGNTINLPLVTDVGVKIRLINVNSVTVVNPPAEANLVINGIIDSDYIMRYYDIAEFVYQGGNSWLLTDGIEHMRLASDITSGIIELATEVECIAGTDNVRAVTPLGLKAAIQTGITQWLRLKGTYGDISFFDISPYQSSIYNYTMRMNDGKFAWAFSTSSSQWSYGNERMWLDDYGNLSTYNGIKCLRDNVFAENAIYGSGVSSYPRLAYGSNTRQTHIDTLNYTSGNATPDSQTIASGGDGTLGSGTVDVYGKYVFHQSVDLVTPTSTDNSTKAATTSFVKTVLNAAIAAIPADKYLQGLSSYNAATNTMTLALNDGSLVSVDMTGLVNDALASIAAATTSIAGIVQLASSNEVITGTDSSKVITPSGLKAALDGGMSSYTRLKGSVGDIVFYDVNDPENNIYNYTMRMDNGSFSWAFSANNVPYEYGTVRMSLNYAGDLTVGNGFHATRDNVFIESGLTGSNSSTYPSFRAGSTTRATTVEFYNYTSGHATPDSRVIALGGDGTLGSGTVDVSGKYNFNQKTTFQSNIEIINSTISLKGSTGDIVFYDVNDPDYSIYNYTMRMDGGQFIWAFSSTNTAYDYGSTKMWLDYTGHLTAAGDITAFSDIRLKTNIRPLENSREIVKGLQGVRYIKDNKESIGFIAQDSVQYIPELILEGKDENKYLSIAYGNITAIHNECLKEHDNMIVKLTQYVNELRRDNKELKELVASLLNSNNK